MAVYVCGTIKTKAVMTMLSGLEQPFLVRSPVNQRHSVAESDSLLCSRTDAVLTGQNRPLNLD